MSRKTDGQSKYFRKFEPASTGVLRKIEEEKVYSINALRVNVQGDCTVIVKGRTLNESTYTALGTIVSVTSASELVDVSTWDYVEYEVSAMSGTPTICVSGFFNTMHPMGELQIGRDYDTLLVDDAADTYNDYTYNLNNKTIKTIRVTYKNASKKDIAQVHVV